MSMKKVICNVYETDFNVEEFLSHNYHYMTRIIEPRNFFSYLRTKNILNLDDQEHIMKYFHTTYMQAGCLIDTILKKGHKGFVAFMEVIEYNYPYLYSDITNQNPRKPPDAFEPIRRDMPFRSQHSMNIIGMMGNLTSQLTSEVIDKSQQLTNLQTVINQIKDALRVEEDRNNSICNELELTNERLRLAYNQLDEKNLEYDKLMEENKENTAKIKLLIEENNNYLNQCNELRLRCENFGSQVLEKLNERCQSLKSNPDVIEKLMNENNSLKRQLKTMSNDDIDISMAPADSKILFFKEDTTNNELETELLELRNLKDQLQIRCDYLEGNATQTRKTIESLLQEKVKDDEKLKFLELKHHQLILANEKLNIECQRYADSYQRMVLEIDNLKKELNITQSHDHEFYQNLQKSRIPSHVAETTTANTEKICKRFGSLHRIYSPLILFFPQVIDDKIRVDLKNHFDQCPIEVIPSNELDKQIKEYEVLQYFENTQQGYKCITITKLQQMQSSVLLSIPASRVLCLMRRSIRPIIVVIKFAAKDHDKINENLAEVENFFMENNITYDTILVDKGLQNEIQKIISLILPKLFILIEENQP